VRAGFVRKFGKKEEKVEKRWGGGKTVQRRHFQSLSIAITAGRAGVTGRSGRGKRAGDWGDVSCSRGLTKKEGLGEKFWRQSRTLAQLGQCDL